jgi:radical SAM protein with 4Fe4S-binding SPASM domain
MCIRATRPFDASAMDFPLFRKIIDEGAPYLRYISFDGPGETIMNPEALPMIRYAKSRGLRVMFSTNATLLEAGIIDDILGAGVDQIIFSINGVTPGVYAAVHGGDCLNQAVANIHRFLARKLERRAKILVAVQMIRLPETIPEVGLFYSRWRHVPGVDFVRVKKDVVCNGAVQESRSEQRRNPCPRLWHGPVFVETNGDVYPSPGVMYNAGPVGNIRENSLGQIWNGERMQAMRKAHACGDLSEVPECRLCNYPRPRLPLIVAGFLLDPFVAGKLVPLAEKLAFWHNLPVFEKTEQ